MTSFPLDSSCHYATKPALKYYPWYPLLELAMMNDRSTAGSHFETFMQTLSAEGS